MMPFDEFIIHGGFWVIMANFFFLVAHLCYINKRLTVLGKLLLTPLIVGAIGYILFQLTFLIPIGY